MKSHSADSGYDIFEGTKTVYIKDLHIGRTRKHPIITSKPTWFKLIPKQQKAGK